MVRLDALLTSPRFCALRARCFVGQICYEMCAGEDAGFTFFGLQYGVECWCSATFSEAAATAGGECDFECSGNPGELCGGNFAVLVYEIIN